jgi:hypothetical protein
LFNLKTAFLKKKIGDLTSDSLQCIKTGIKKYYVLGLLNQPGQE